MGRIARLAPLGRQCGGAALLLADDAGDGDTPVDTTPGGPTICGCCCRGGRARATVRAYLKGDYDARNYVEAGRTATADDGRWAAPMYLTHGLTYTITCSKPGVSGVSVKEVTA